MLKVNKFIKKIIKMQNNLTPLSQWVPNCQSVTVSVHCFVYNHANFLSRCFDSILKQLVNFNVEIVVHDDCSIDNSKYIINSYHKRYPSIFKPIIEKENLFKKNGSFLSMAVVTNSISTGKYIAICEGDDYWTDPLKLFLQLSVLENYSNCHFCVHRVQVLAANKEYALMDKTLPSFRMKTRMFNDISFISLISERYTFQTSSYFFKKQDYDAFLSEMPSFLRTMPTLDESLIRFFGSLGNTCFIDKLMSTYFQFTSGSWSKEHQDNKDNSKREHFVQAVNEFDDYSKYRYHKSCKKLVLKTRLFALVESNQFGTIFLNKDLRKILCQVDFKTYLSLRLRKLFGKI